MPATSRVLRAWLPVVVVAVVASLLFQLLGLPSPVLFGSLTGGDAVRPDVHDRAGAAATGAFSLIAGGASGIVALARELGADDRVVTIVQYLRVLIVLVAMPLVTGLVFHPPSGAGSLVTGPTRWLPDLVFVTVAVTLGLTLQRVFRAPATALSARCSSPWRCPRAGCSAVSRSRPRWSSSVWCWPG